MLAALQAAELVPAKLSLGRARGAVWLPPAGVALELETHVAKRCLLIGTAGGFTEAVTGQTLAVLLLSALLGSKRASLTVIAYLLEGLAGLPVFAGARGGPAALIGPTGGYLVAFIAAAYVVGLLAEKGADRRFGTTVVTMIIGNAIIYIGGIMWLSCLISLSRVEFGFNRLLTIGVYPFIVGDVLKILLAGLLLPSGWRILGRPRGDKDLG